jgi:hypothetical protein
VNHRNAGRARPVPGCLQQHAGPGLAELVIVVNAVAGEATVLIDHSVGGRSNGGPESDALTCRKYTLCKIHCDGTCREPSRD